MLMGHTTEDRTGTKALTVLQQRSLRQPKLPQVEGVVARRASRMDGA
jgi:hypothetical protein